LSRKQTQDIDRKSLKLLALGVLWPTGIGVPLVLIAQAGTISRAAIFVLVVVGSSCLSIAVRLHGWSRRFSRCAILYAAIWGGLSTLGWVARPQPKVAAIEMKISPSGFPISIPAHSTVSILRINPNRILDATGDYLLKLDNTRGVDVSWPSDQDVTAKIPNEYETVFRVEIANHSVETLATGELLFRITYNAGSLGGGCMPPKGTPTYQNDFVLIPQLDPGKTFEFYAINETSSCAWLIPPDAITAKLTSDAAERQVQLKFNSDPLYMSGAPWFPPTKIAWGALPSRPRSYQIMRKEY
jgi:hypothetical protein